MSHSIVEYFPDHEGYKCGYCKQLDTAFSRGMWAHKLATGDYLALINRGWRRSGKYCYKPTMKKTCCPQYEIKCDVSQIKLSKSQKKVIRKMKKFLLEGDANIPKVDSKGSSTSSDLPNDNVGLIPMEITNSQIEDVALNFRVDSDASNLDEKEEKTVKSDDILKESEIEENIKSEHLSLPKQQSEDANIDSVTSETTKLEKRKPNKGLGADPNKPRCMKAKYLRNEKKKAKLAKKGVIAPSTSSIANEQQKQTTLEDLPHLNHLEGAKHVLRVNLVRSHPHNDEFELTSDTSYQLYKKYQMAVHNDTEDECTKKQWKRFLVESPLIAIEVAKEHGIGYGTFHCQYWLDDKLIAVEVIDILPSLISSVYVYYDVDYSSLSLGVYTALSEIQLTRKYNKLKPDMKYYCMGYYIETCAKMRYKGAYSPSYLLCPETYQWCSLDKCRETLQKTKYARLNILDGGSADDVSPDSFTDPIDKRDLQYVLILHKHQVLRYQMYKSIKYGFAGTQEEVNEDNEVGQYASLVGRKSSTNHILLYRE